MRFQITLEEQKNLFLFSFGPFCFVGRDLEINNHQQRSPNKCLKNAFQGKGKIDIFIEINRHAKHSDF